MKKINKIEKRNRFLSQNEHYYYFMLFGLFFVFLFFSCDQKKEEVLLRNLIIPENYNIIEKRRFFAEGELYKKTDSIYILKSGVSLIKITLKHFDNNITFSSTTKNNINNKINEYIDEWSINNETFRILNKRYNEEKFMWYVHYTYGSTNNLLYNFHMERWDSKYKIIVEADESYVDIDDINFLYNVLYKL
mgnify:CR=1 FL=1|jgi:hypothetical protein